MCVCVCIQGQWIIKFKKIFWESIIMQNYARELKSVARKMRSVRMYNSFQEPG
jgi:hypothetical protein